MHNAVASAARSDAEAAKSNRESWVDALFGKILFIIPFGVMGNVAFALLAIEGPLCSPDVHFAPGFAVVAMLLSVIPWFTGSFRLQLWCRFLGKRLRYQEVFRIVLGAELGAAISPPLIGGTAVKTGMLMQHGFSGGSALSLAALESMEDGLFFICMLPVAFMLISSHDIPVLQSLFAGIHYPSWWMVLLGCGIAASVFLFLAHPKIRTQVTHLPLLIRVAAGIRSAWDQGILAWGTIIAGGKTVFVLTFLLTAISWLCRYAIISLLLTSFGLSAQPLLFTALQVILFALMSFIPMPGGVGGVEGLFYLLYQPFIAAGSLGAVTIGWRFLTFYFVLLLAGIIFFFMESPKQARSRRNGEQTEEAYS